MTLASVLDTAPSGITLVDLALPCTVDCFRYAPQANAKHFLGRAIRFLEVPLPAIRRCRKHDFFKTFLHDWIALFPLGTPRRQNRCRVT